jgi:hypothetical protein
MKTLNPNIYPKGGFSFKESDGATIHGDSWNGVVARVVWYRKNAKYPPGNPVEEVMMQACQRTPALCHENNDSYLTQKASLKSRVLTYLNGWRANKDKQFVSAETARARANVCAQCPLNRSIPDGCASCMEAVRLLRTAVIGRRFVDGRLTACEALGEDLPTSVHLESQTVDDALPAPCWRRRSL